MKVINDKINLNKEDQSMDFNNTLVVGEENSIIKKLITVLKKIKGNIIFYFCYFVCLYFIIFLLTGTLVEPTLNNITAEKTSLQTMSTHIFTTYLSIGCVFVTNLGEVQYDYDNVFIITDSKISKLSNPEGINQENYTVNTEINLEELENLEIAEDNIIFEETSGKKILIPNRDGIAQEIQNKLYNI